MPSHLKTNMNIYIWMIANLHRVEPKHIAGDESCCLAPITTVLFCHHICYRLNQYTWTCGTHTIEERWKQKARQRSWRRVVGKICSIPYHASFCASVYMEETVEFCQSIWKKRLNSTVSWKSTKTKKLARQGIEQILSPQPTQQPLPCLLFPSFFYDSNIPFTALSQKHFVT